MKSVDTRSTLINRYKYGVQYRRTENDLWEIDRIMETRHISGVKWLYVKWEVTVASDMQSFARLVDNWGIFDPATGHGDILSWKTCGVDTYEITWIDTWIPARNVAT